MARWETGRLFVPVRSPPTPADLPGLAMGKWVDRQISLYAITKSLTQGKYCTSPPPPPLPHFLLSTFVIMPQKQDVFSSNQQCFPSLCQL